VRPFQFRQNIPLPEPALNLFWPLWAAFLGAIALPVLPLFTSEPPGRTCTPTFRESRAEAASRRPSVGLELKSSPTTKLRRLGTIKALSRCISFAKGSHRDKLHYIGSAAPPPERNLVSGNRNNYVAEVSSRRPASQNPTRGFRPAGKTRVSGGSAAGGRLLCALGAHASPRR